MVRLIVFLWNIFIFFIEKKGLIIIKIILKIDRNEELLVNNFKIFILNIVRFILILKN